MKSNASGSTGLKPSKNSRNSPDASPERAKARERVRQRRSQSSEGVNASVMRMSAKGIDFVP